MDLATPLENPATPAIESETPLIRPLRQAIDAMRDLGTPTHLPDPTTDRTTAIPCTQLQMPCRLFHPPLGPTPPLRLTLLGRLYPQPKAQAA